MSHRLVATRRLLFAAGCGIVIYALWIGIDFGTHWDEVIQYNLVKQSYQYELVLPHFYEYPSMIYWFDLASVSDKLLALFFSIVDRGIFWSRVYTTTSKVFSPIGRPGELIELGVAVVAHSP